MDFFVGTLTREGGEGILRCRLNENRLERIGLISGITDPNYLILRPDGQRLYAVSSDVDRDGQRGCVNEYDLSGQEPDLLSRQPTYGNAPCHLTFSTDGRYLYCANYGTGSIAVFPLEGGLQPAVQIIQHEGCGPDPRRQAGPHVHQVSFLPGTNILCAVDLGTDALYLYHASSVDGKLTFRDKVTLSGGPRHIAWTNKGIGYLAHELSNEVTVLRWQEDRLRPLQTLPTLPVDFTEKNTAAAIRVTDHQVFVSNRGHGSIAIYDRRDNGLLNFNGWMDAGEYPRDFVILPGCRMLIADQHAGVWLRDVHGSVLDFLPQKGAVCIAAT